MDEPFGALDPLTRAEMQDMLRTLLATLQKTVLLVTHDLDEALYLGDRIVLLSEGRLIASLTPAEFTHAAQPEIVAYIRAYHRAEPDPLSDSQSRDISRAPSFRRSVPKGWESNEPQQRDDNQ